MFKNYLKIAIRNLWKGKTFTALNVIGLSVAFCVAILLSISALDDLSENQFHENKDNLYRLYATEQSPKGPKEATSMPTPLAPTLKSEIPAVAKITRHLEDNRVVSYGDKDIQLDALYIDEDFFELFSFPIIEGNSGAPLTDKSSAVITAEAAKILFDEEDPIGKTILVEGASEKEAYTVSAIMDNKTKESSMDFQVVIAFEKNPYYQQTETAWNSRYHAVYLQLAPGSTPLQFEETTRGFVDKYFAEEIDNAVRDGYAKDANGRYIQFRLLPFIDKTFTTFEGGIAQVSRAMPYSVLGIAALILFIASVNFINMNVARGNQRLREIGMRKTLGASKQQLFIQLWLESILVFSISLVLGLLLGYTLLGEFQTLFRTSGSFETLIHPQIIVLLIAAVLSITFIAGGYPALLLSKLGTLKALSGKLEVKEGSLLRNTLIVVQFSIAILLISGTMVLSKQIDFLRNKDLGFDKNNVVSVPLNGSLDSRLALKRLRFELQDEAEVLSITAADNNLGFGKDGSSYSSVSGFDYKGRGIKTNSLTVDFDYIETLGLELVSGRSHDRNFSTDSLAMVINESMAKEYGEENPLDVRVAFNDSLFYSVIGVVKDYNFAGVKRQVEPITFYMSPSQGYYYAFVKVKPESAISAYDKIEKAWATIEPGEAFLGSFLDENIDRTLRREKILSKIITSGSIGAIILSCIGLFAMSMIVVNQRTKEIGIRKIVGASVAGLVKLLLSDFMKLVVLAFIVATPVAWWLSDHWLQDYTYRTSLGFGVFTLAGILAFVIAILTIG
ncbi:MAG: ABC transporter permease [Bacteroidota bacterium]